MVLVRHGQSMGIRPCCGMKWHLHPDGSFDLITATGSLLGAWPGIDHHPVRAVRVEVGHTPECRAKYHLADGSQIHLVFTDSEGELGLQCRMSGSTTAPHWIHPLCDARVEGFDKVFRQGQGFSGPTGFVAIDRHLSREKNPPLPSPWNIDSHLLVGLAGSGAGDLLVAGPLDHRDFVWKAELHSRQIRGSFRNREVHEHLVSAEFGFRTERIALADGTLTLPAIRFSEDADAFAALRAHAQAVASAYGIRCSAPPTYHYCSWYYKAFNYRLTDLLDVCAGLTRTDPVGRVQTVQIDDGYMTAHGDWLTSKTDLWPGGLEPAFRAIADTGRRPGIWVAPFMVGSSSRLAQQHPDWLLHWADGSRVIEWKDYDGTKTDFEHYVLDTSHPDALAWIRTVFRTMYAHGARFFKTDFLEWGFKDSTAVRRHTPGLTSMQYVRQAMQAIRDEIGSDSHWLACISYFAPMLGLADGMRVASDVSLSWNAPGGTGNDGTGGGTHNMIEEMYSTHYLNQVWWENDPDVVYLRDHHVLHEDGAWQALACWHGIMGTSVNTSDEIHLYPADRRAWWDFLRPGPRGMAWLPFFSTGHTFRIAVREVPGGWAVLLLNDRPHQTYGRVALSTLVGVAEAQAWNWNPDLARSMGTLSELAIELPSQRHLLVFISRDHQPPTPGMSLQGDLPRGN